jgi:hypothetical protein
MKPDAWKLIAVLVATIMVAVLYFYVTWNDPKRHNFVMAKDWDKGVVDIPSMWISATTTKEEDYKYPQYIIAIRPPPAIPQPSEPPIITSRPPSN